MSNGRARADAVRAIPLARVAAGMGYRRDPADKARWKRPGSVISINGGKFYDHIAGCGGGGAIDLAMHVAACPFLKALDILEGMVPGSTAGPQAGPWQRVEDYLVGRRCLDPGLIGQARRAGILGADSRANAVFVCRDGNGGRTGGELVGTGAGRPFRGMQAGSRKSAGGFWIGSRKTGPALLVEGAIDALSAWSLADRTQIGIVISTAGVTGRMPEWICGLRLDAVFCGYDADEAGDDAASMLEQRYPGIGRMRPGDGEDGIKDWNDMLQRCRDRQGAGLEKKR